MLCNFFEHMWMTKKTWFLISSTRKKLSWLNNGFDFPNSCDFDCYTCWSFSPWSTHKTEKFPSWYVSKLHLSSSLIDVSLGPHWYLPIVGNTPQLRKIAIKLGGQHKAFEKLSEDYRTPVIGLKLGRELVVVALTYPIVKEIHSRDEFDGRPDNFFLRLRTMGTRW